MLREKLVANSGTIMVNARHVWAGLSIVTVTVALTVVVVVKKLVSVSCKVSVMGEGKVRVVDGIVTVGEKMVSVLMMVRVMGVVRMSLTTIKLSVCSVAMVVEAGLVAVYEGLSSISVIIKV